MAPLPRATELQSCLLFVSRFNVTKDSQGRNLQLFCVGGAGLNSADIFVDAFGENTESRYPAKVSLVAV